MSPKPELLSPERLAEIQEDSEVALYWMGGQRYPTDDMAARAVNAVPELLADRVAFRQQVASALHEYATQLCPRDFFKIKALAAGLGMELP